jgi:TPR repeat protein
MRPSDLDLNKLLNAEPDALYQQALRLRNGDGVVQDLHRARRLLGLVALHGHAAARYLLGLMNAKGEGGEKNPVRALMWFHLAAGRDEPRAAAQIQRWSAELLPAQVRQAQAWVVEGEHARKRFSAVRREQDWEAMAMLGHCVFNGVGAEPDHELALVWLRPAATRDEPQAQLLLAIACAYGLGTQQDTGEAQRLFRLAASQDLVEANYEWARFLEQHTHERPSRIKAIELYDIAARHGHLQAQLRLGQLFKGGEADTVDAGQLSKDASSTGAAKKLTYKPSHSPNLVCALQYFSMAAAQGHVESQFELGQMYAQGLGTIQRFDQAVIWYERAAQQGHARAQFNLAFMVTHGQGVEENLLKAYEWYRISHLCGYSLAKKSMEVTAKKLSPGEVEMADWRADSFVHRLEQ